MVLIRLLVFLSCLMGFIGMIGVASVHADTNNISVDDPLSAAYGAALTGVFGGNSVGYYTGNDGNVYSFLISGSNYTILKNPLAINGTLVNGITGSTLFGNYFDSNHLEFGFTTSDETNYTKISNPFAVNGTSVTGLSGSNLIGNYIDGSRHTNAYFLSGTNDITISDPAGIAYTTTLVGVSGTSVTGEYTDVSNGVHGFLFEGTNYITIDDNDPSAAPDTTTVVGISGGIVAGNYADLSSNSHGFLFDGTNYTSIDDPNEVGGTWITGISGSNVVGNYVDGTPSTNGFLTADGVNFATINDPLGVSTTQVLGIGGGTIFGTFNDSNAITHNFVTQDGTNYTTVDGPPDGTVVIAMSGSNAVGTYLDIARNTVSFFFDGSNFTTISDPNAAYGQTAVVGVSGSGVAGTYMDANSGNTYGFLYSGGIYTSVTGPAAAGGLGINSINGISGSGVVGTYIDTSSGNTFGFLYSGGSYTTIYGPQGSNALGLNSMSGISGGLVFGTYTDANSGYLFGFTYSTNNATTNGTNYGTIEGPLGTNGGINSLSGISGSNAVGTYMDPNSGNTYGFLLAGTNYTIITGPDGTNGNGVTAINGISGDNVVGSYMDLNSVEHGFLFNGTNYTVIDFPGAQPGSTIVNGVVGSLIFGGYSDSNGLSHGFYIQRASQSITLPSIPPQTYGVPYPSTNLLATNSFGLPITYTVLSGSATLSNNVLTFTGAGSVTLVASQPGNNTYYAAPPVTNTITVVAGAQTISFGAIASQTYGVPFVVSPTASSRLPVSVSVLSGAATNSGLVTNAGIIGTTITPTGVGTVTLAANQPGNANYLAAPQVTNTFTVLQATQSIAAFTGITNIPFTTNPVIITLPAANSGLPVTLTATGAATNGGGTNGNNILTLLGAGTVTLTASQPGNSNYLAATPVSTNFLVTKGSQTIAAFAGIANQTYGNAPFAVTPPAANSGLPVTLSVLSGPATLSNNTVTLTGAGTVTLAADQPGNANFAAATQVTTSFSVGQAAQSITPFATIPNQSGTSPVTITLPTASSGLPVSVSVLSGNATISGNVVTPTSSPATITLAANQAGNSNYLAAPQVTTSFSVGKTEQTIAPFGSIANQTYGAAPFSVTPPAASSGLPVTLSVLSGPATISGNTVTLTGVGRVVLAADQSGNATYGPAAQVTTSFTVSSATQSISAFQTIGAQSYGGSVTITPPTASSGLPVTVSVLSGPATISGNTVSMTGVGTVVLAANQAGNEDYAAATQVTTSFTVGQASQSISSFTIENQTYGVAPFSVTPPTGGSSGNPVILTILSGPATISNNVITITGAGNVIVAANQAGNSNYSAASQVTTSFSVAQASQSISAFQPIGSQSYGASVTITPPTASSGLPVTVSVLSGPATISGNTVTMTGVGMVVLAANQEGNADYFAATQVTTSFTVSQAAQSISSFSIGNQTYGAAPFSVTPPAGGNSGNPVILSILSGPATISGNVITITGAGNVTVAADQAGNSNYSAAAQVTSGFSVAQASQSITAFGTIGAQSYGTSLMVTLPTASSGLPVSVSVLSGPATISGNTVTMTGVGKVILVANQAGNADYAAASQETTSFQVVKASQTISSFTIPNQIAGTAPFSVTPPAGGNSGNPVVLSILSGPATISNNVITVTGVGNVTVAAAQAGNADYAAASQVTTTFSVGKTDQSIAAFGSIANQTYGAAPFTVTAPAASSGLRVTLSVLSGPATIYGNTVTLTGVGTVVLAADQAGNDIYGPASQVTTSFTVSQASQSISAFQTIGDQSYGGSVTITPSTASSGLPVTVSVLSGPATISGNTVTMTGVGMVVLAANQGGNADYAAATQVTTSFTVGQASQSISSFSIGNQTYGVAPFSVTPPAGGNSGNPVVLSILSGPATISGNVITITGAGNVTVAANQAGNSNYAAASQVTSSFSVAPASQSITAFQTIGSPSYGGSVTITPPTASSGLPVTVSVLSGPATISGNTVTMTGVGMVVLAANQGGNADYAAATQVTTRFTVGLAGQTISSFTIPNQTYGAPPFIVTPPTGGSSGNPVILSILSGPATISGNVITLTGAGNVTVAANQAGNSDYAAASQVTSSFSVALASQSITAFPTIGSQSYGASVTLTPPTASSGLPVTVSVLSGPATISGNRVTMTGIGMVVLAANQGGNGNYAAATQVTTSFTVGQASQGISSFSIGSQTYGAAPFSVTPPAGGNSGNPVVLSILSGPATISGNVITLTGAGNVTVAANQAGNSDYAAASQVTSSFSVAPASQTIEPFASIPPQKFSKKSHTLVVTPPTGGASGEPIILSILSGPATISNNIVTFTAKGLVTLAANQAGNGNYSAAPQVTTSFLVGLKAQSVTITFAGFPPPADPPYYQFPYTTKPLKIAAKATSGLPVKLSILSGPAKIVENKVVLTGVGSVTVAANQKGNGQYEEADEVTASFTATQASQTIKPFPVIHPPANGSPFTIHPPAGGSSGNPVILSILSGPATISGNKVTPTGAGAVVVAANQAGDDDYAPAEQVTAMFTVE